MELLLYIQRYYSNQKASVSTIEVSKTFSIISCLFKQLNYISSPLNLCIMDSIMEVYAYYWVYSPFKVKQVLFAVA